jgi:hypothetical protein
MKLRCAMNTLIALVRRHQVTITYTEEAGRYDELSAKALDRPLADEELQQELTLLPLQTETADSAARLATIKERQAQWQRFYRDATEE